jgi:hypothetical protein
MMIRFAPPELRDRLIHARDVLANVCRGWEFFPLDGDFDPDDYDVEVTEGTEIRITLNEALEAVDGTVSEVLWWADCLEKGRLVDRGTVVVPGQTIFYVTPISEEACGIAYHGYPCALSDLGVVAALNVGGIECSVTLVQEFTAFSLFAEKELECDNKVYPSYGERDIFAVVSHKGELEPGRARALCASYLFQLATCHDLVFGFAGFPSSELGDYADFPTTDEGDIGLPLTIRPLDVSTGMPELHDLYLEGATSNNLQWSFVSFVKAVEYVSMTVIKRTAHNEIRARLTAQEALRPHAAYIEGLIELVQQQREYGKQREYIRRTIQECCDLPRVAQLLPAYLGGPGRIAAQEREQKAVVEDLCDAIIATRNYLVHAKAAYESSGKECPDTELREFLDCVKAIAFQAITWYQNLPEHARVAED